MQSKKEKETDFTEYELLTPNDTIENKAEDALGFALHNKQIKNIALTGQYSSGKSSIIQSYFNKYMKEKEYLKISLATFKKNESEEEIIEASNSLEKIIIEKLYYSVLNKYDMQRDIISSVISGIVTILINLGIYLFNIKSINNSFVNNFWFTLIFSALEIICLTTLIAYSISYVMNLHKLKLKIGDVEVEVNHSDGRDKSRNLLNEEIDFIMKAMNIGRYKYVIFEDLDRFQNPKIFERLRDLNITLNSALKQKVKFIYAIKDEMFIADNRTKFFDFIIPVVPYVSYENSGEELLKIVKKHGLESELSEDFILDVSLYISDMRILKNTVNEYIIYKKTLGKVPPNYEKLFSILLYKNTCSEDFAKLQNKDGELYKCFSNKKQKIEELIKQKNELIEKKNKEYNEIQKNIISKNHLKELLIYNITSKVSGSTITLKNENYNNIDIRNGMNINMLTDEIIFSEDTLIYCYRNRWIEEPLFEFLNNTSPEFFEQFKLYIEGIDKIKERINREIQFIKNEIEIIKEGTLSELMQEENNLVQIKLGDYSELTKYLLSNGYIDENYNTYINKFHQGSITEKDYNFIMNVRNRKENDYKEKLDNSIKIIKRLKNTDFKKEEILNVDILDVLLENKEYIEKKKIYFNTLMKSNRYIDFVKYCICESTELKNKKKLLIDLCYFDKDILKKIQESKIEQKYRNLILENIVIENETSKLKELNGIEDSIKEIEKNNLLSDANFNNIKNKVSEFNLKYYNISELKNNIELYKHIIENNRYQINYENILDILIDNEKSNKKDIEEKNYEMISKNKPLKGYIDTNIQYYIDNVYIKLPNDQHDEITIIKELLNNSNIKIESKYVIINKESNQINNITEIEDSGLWKNIFDNNLVEITWNNINSYYKNNGFDECLIKIFNDADKRKNILLDNILIENESSTKFVKELLLSNNLTDEAYDLIIKMSKYKLEDTELNQLNKDRILKLIINKRIALNLEMLENIRKCSTDILIAFIKNNYSYIHREIDNSDIMFDLTEINEILKSDVTPAIKSKCIRMIPNEENEDISIDLAENITLVSIENNFNGILGEVILLKIVSDIQDADLKVKLLNLNFNVVNKDNIMDYLVSLEGDYSRIIVDRTRPKFVNNKQNRLLLENIKNLGYNINYDIYQENIILRNTLR